MDTSFGQMCAVLTFIFTTGHFSQSWFYSGQKGGETGFQNNQESKVKVFLIFAKNLDKSEFYVFFHTKSDQEPCLLLYDLMLLQDRNEA